MVENLQRKTEHPEGIEIRNAHMGKIIGNIPNDGNTPFVFSLMIGQGVRFGDAVVELSDPTFETEIYLEPITFRSGFGGGALPCIAEELSALFGSFENHGGKIPPEYKRENHNEDKFPQYISATVQKGKNPEDSRYIIKNLQNDDEQADELRNFLDIEITREGNAIVTQRFFHPDLKVDSYVEEQYKEEQYIEGRHVGERYTEEQGQVVFKTKENGGKFPIMAEVFTRIAERIINAKERKK